MKGKIKALFKEYYNDETMPVVELAKLHPTLSLNWEEDRKDWLSLHYNYKVEDDW